MQNESADNEMELLSTIQTTLGRAIDCVISFAEEQGLKDAFPEEEFQLQYWKPDDGDSTRGHLVTDDRREPSFRSFYFTWRDKLDTAEPIVTLNALCEDFKNRHGVAMSKYWWSDYGRTILARYFGRIGKFIQDPSVATKVVDEFRQDLTAPVEQIELVYYVENLRANSPFALWKGKVSFAPVSDEDLRTYARRQEVLLTGHHFHLDWSGWICRILMESNKSTFEDYNNATDHLDALLNALSLVSEGRATFHLLAKQVTNTFLDVGRQSGGEPVPSGWGGPIYLSASAVAKLDEMLPKIIRVSTDGRLKLLRLPLRRMRAAASRKSAADAFLDTVIALEGLLAHDTPALESTYRFRLRGAALLSAEFGTPRERLKSLDDMYSMRSRIVHGNIEDAELSPMLEQATRVLKFIFLRYLEESQGTSPEDVIRKIDEGMVQHAGIVAIDR